jgi:hypothetical protein
MSAFVKSAHHCLSPSTAASGHDEKSAVMAPAFSSGLNPMGRGGNKLLHNSAIYSAHA